MSVDISFRAATTPIEEPLIELVCMITCVRGCMYAYELARSHIRADLRIYPGVQVHRVGRDGGDEVLDDEVVEATLLAVELG